MDKDSYQHVGMWSNRSSGPLYLYNAIVVIYLIKARNVRSISDLSGLIILSITKSDQDGSSIYLFMIVVSNNFSDICSNISYLIEVLK